MTKPLQITSRQNAKIKQLRALRQPKERQASGLFVLEGLFHIGAAWEAGAEIEYALYCPEMLGEGFGRELVSKMQAAGIPIYSTTKDILTSAAEKEGPQGLLAAARQPEHTLEQLPSGAETFLVALEAPQDPGNLGTILRTAEGLGAHGLVILGNGVDLYHPTAVRAGMGAHFWLPAAQAELGEFLDWARQGGFHLYGSSARQGEAPETRRSFARPCALLLGSEREGLSAQALAACEEVISLPMQGRVTSLNLAVAGGILMHALLSGRQ